MNQHREDVVFYVDELIGALDALADDDAEIEREQLPDEPSGATAISVSTIAGGFRCTIDDTWITVEEYTSETEPPVVRRDRLVATEDDRYLVIDGVVRRLTARLHDAGHL